MCPQGSIETHLQLIYYIKSSSLSAVAVCRETIGGRSVWSQCPQSTWHFPELPLYCSLWEKSVLSSVSMHSVSQQKPTSCPSQSSREKNPELGPVQHKFSRHMCVYILCRSIYIRKRSLTRPVTADFGGCFWLYLLKCLHLVSVIAYCYHLLKLLILQ